MANSMPTVIWSFTTEDATDPAVIANSPLGPTDVPRDTNIVFDIQDTGSGVDLSTLVVTVDGDTAYDWDGLGGDPNAGFQAGYSGTVVDIGSGTWRVTIDPDALFPNYYSVSVSIAASDIAGNAMTPYGWAFQTLDETYPTVTGTSPSGTGVPRTTPVQFDISDTGLGVDLANTVVTVNGVPVYDWDGLGGDPNAGFQVGWDAFSSVTGSPSSYHFTIYRNAGFNYETVYLVSVVSQDLESPPNVMPAAEEWSFETEVGDFYPPTVENQDPAPNDVDVPFDKNIYLEIHDTNQIDPDTVHIEVNGEVAYDGLTGPGAGFVVVVDDSVLTNIKVNINPTSDFEVGETVSVRVQAQDVNTNELDSTYSFTAAVPPTIENVYPTPSTSEATPDTHIRFSLRDWGGAGIDIGTLVVRVNGADAIIGASIQSGYSGTIQQDDSTSEIDYLVDLIPDEPFVQGDTVTVYAYVEDLGVPLSVEDTWNFGVGVDKPVAIIRYSNINALFGSIIQMDGRKSYDPLELPLTFHWSFTRVPSGSAVNPDQTVPPSPDPYPFESLRPNHTAVKFIPDITGVYEVQLIVNNGFRDSDPATAVVNIGLSQVPCGEGIIPEADFLWNYISNFWDLVEDKGYIEAVWSAALSLSGAELTKTWSNDYNKSLATIQPNVHRRWQKFNLRTQLLAESQRVIVGDTDDGIRGKTGVIGPSPVSESIGTGTAAAGETFSGTLTLPDNYTVVRGSIALPHPTIALTTVAVDDGEGNILGVGPYSVSGSIDYTTGAITVIESGVIWNATQDVLVNFQRDTEYTNEFYLDSLNFNVVQQIGEGTSDNDDAYDGSLGDPVGNSILPGTFSLWNEATAAQIAEDFSSEAKATGSITAVIAANISDGETVTISDGETIKTLEFDKLGDGVSVGNVEVSLIGATTADDVRDRILTALAGITGFNVTGSSGGPGLVSLEHTQTGIIGNVHITNTVADDGFVVDGMSGGYKPGDIYGSNKATGSITTVAVVNIVDGETVTINDGLTGPKVLEFDRIGDGVTPGNYEVSLVGLTSSDDVRDAIISTISGIGDNFRISASNGGDAKVLLEHDLPGRMANNTITKTVAHPNFLVSGMSGGYEVIGELDYDAWTYSFAEDGPAWGSGEVIRAQFTAKPYFIELAKLDNRGNASGRVLVINGEGYTIDRVYDTASESVIIVDETTIPGGLQNATWRVPHILHTPAIDLEDFGVRVGDILVFQVIRQDVYMSAELRAQIVGVDRDRVGFEFTLAELSPGDPNVDVELFEQLVRDLNLVPESAEDEEVEATARSLLSFMPSGINISARPFTPYRIVFKAKEIIHNNVIRVHSKYVAIPSLQEEIYEPPVVLRENWDYALGDGELQFQPGLFGPTSPSPEVLWAECSMVDNTDAIQDNFGRFVGIGPEDLANTRLAYLSAVKGLWYAITNGPTVENIRLGLQILLGLPFAEERGVIIDIRDDFSTEAGTGLTLGRMVVEELDEADQPTGRRQFYFYPTTVGLEDNPATEEAYKVGDIIERWAPISQGVEVTDYVKDPTWWLKSLQGLEVLKYFIFRVAINGDVFDVEDTSFALEFLRKVKPSYTRVVVQAYKNLSDDPLGLFREYLASTSSEAEWEEPDYLSPESRIEMTLYDNPGGAAPAYRLDDLNSQGVVAWNDRSRPFTTRTVRFIRDLYTWWDGPVLKATTATGFAGSDAITGSLYPLDDRIRGRVDGDATPGSEFPVREGDILVILRGQEGAGDLYDGLYEIESVVDNTTVVLRNTAPHFDPDTYAIQDLAAASFETGGPLRASVVRRMTNPVVSGSDLAADGSDTVTSALAKFEKNGVVVDDHLVLEDLDLEFRVEAEDPSNGVYITDGSLKLVDMTGAAAAVPGPGPHRFRVIRPTMISKVVRGVQSVYRNARIELEVMDPGDVRNPPATPPGTPMDVFTPGMVGTDVHVRDSADPQNDGVWTITEYIHPGCVAVNNPSVTGDGSATATAVLDYPYHQTFERAPEVVPHDRFSYVLS